jgi:diacylglycerol kinase
MKLHLISGLLSVGLGVYLNLSIIEWAFIALAIGIVLICETINTAIEENVNLATSDYNEHAKHAKDAAAGATLIASFFAAIIGALLFIPKLLELIKG